MDGSSLVSSAALIDMIRSGGDLNAVRMRVRAWVERHAAYPCRTYATSEGIGTYYHDLDGTLQHVFVPLDADIATRYVEALHEQPGIW